MSPRRFSSVIFASFLLFGLSATTASASWAIAYANGKSPIISGNWPSASDAKSRALNACNSYYGANACKIVLTGNNACYSFANASSTKWAFGKGMGGAKAAQDALSNCQSQFGNACKVVRTQCD